MYDAIIMCADLHCQCLDRGGIRVGSAASYEEEE